MFFCCCLSINKIKRSLIQKMYIGSSWNVYQWWIFYSHTFFPMKICNWAKFLNVELCNIVVHNCQGNQHSHDQECWIIIKLAGATHIPPMIKNALHLFFKKCKCRHQWLLLYRKEIQEKQYGVVLRKVAFVI